MDTTTAARVPGTSMLPDRDALADHSALLLRDVRRRAEPVLALAAARSWPEQELTTLTSFLRSTVLRRIAEEEQSFPNEANGPSAAEHTLLQVVTDDLERADRATGSVVDLADEVVRLLRLLEHHLIAEQTLRDPLLDPARR